MEQRTLIKVICQAVTLVKDGDKILREETSQPVGCYSIEETAEFWATARAEVDSMNTANRKQRRAK